jgi:MFS family permease
MWGLSMALVLPYASVFMLAMGLRDEQVGFLATAGVASQMIWGFASGVLTDVLGRRRTLFIFDIITWVVPSIIWALAQNFWFFLAAALINGVVQVPANAWDCLMVEDAEREDIPKIYSLVGVASNCAAFLLPISALLVSQWGLVHAVRILYVNAAVVMMAKILILYRFSTETRQGKIRMQETKGVPLRVLFGGYRHVVRRLILAKRGALFALVIMALVAAVTLVTGAFWPVVVTQHLGVPDAMLPFFPMARSLLAIVFYFTVIPRLLKAVDLKHPTMWGFAAWLLGQAIVVAIPAHSTASAAVYVALAGTVILDSFGAGILFMLSESLVALHVDEAERSRVMAVQRTAVMLASAPFGWIAGWLSGMDRVYPFVLTSALLLAGLLLAALRWVPTGGGVAEGGAAESAGSPADGVTAPSPEEQSV